MSKSPRIYDCGHAEGVCGCCPRCRTCYFEFGEDHVCSDGFKGYFRYFGNFPKPTYPPLGYGALPVHLSKAKGLLRERYVTAMLAETETALGDTSSAVLIGTDPGPEHQQRRGRPIH